MLFKIFLTFWLTLAAIVAGQEALSMIAQRDEQAAMNDARAIIADAQTVADAYARGGVPAARETSLAFERTRGARVDLLDRQRRSVFGYEVRPALLAVARLADRAVAEGLNRSVVNLGEHAAAKQVAAPNGERLTLAVDLPGHGVARAATGWSQSPLARYATVIILGGVICFAVARHFSHPLVRLADAANALADGRLQTRVGERVTRRHDEVGRLARDFDRMAGRIEALVAGQRRMLGDVSHELRSPLARLTVASGLARKIATADTVEYFDRIDIEAARLDHLIEQLLTLARIESAVDDELRGTVNLTELVQEVVSDGNFEARASGKQVTLVEADEAVLRGRPDLLRSALENIVRNAIRYTGQGTAVEVALRRSMNGSPRATLSVHDRGPGVPETQVSDMFRRFWRAEGPPEHVRSVQTASDGGAGLGLAIADSVVRLHGGTIGAANAPAGGLMVTIDLPLSV
jgi:two-component system, OmpR family, sensor histidine kinase CpxA